MVSRGERCGVVDHLCIEKCILRKNEGYILYIYIKKEVARPPWRELSGCGQGRSTERAAGGVAEDKTMARAKPYTIHCVENIGVDRPAILL